MGLLGRNTRMSNAELSGKAKALKGAMPIRTEGRQEYGQGQSVGGGIILPRVRVNQNG